MKIRNGFVSNSSSASFVVAFPRDKFISLKEIEDYIGGINEDLSPEARGILAFKIWNLQYFETDSCYVYRRDTSDTGKEYYYYKCIAPWEYLKDRIYLGLCPRYGFEGGEKIPEECLNCEHLNVEIRSDRGDDFYSILDAHPDDTEIQEWLMDRKDKKLLYFRIEGNEATYLMPYDIASNLVDGAEVLFKSSENIHFLSRI